MEPVGGSAAVHDEPVQFANPPPHPGRVVPELSGGDAGRRPVRWRPLKTIALYAVTLWAVVTLVFLLPRLLPGDPLRQLDDPGSKPGTSLRTSARARRSNRVWPPGGRFVIESFMRDHHQIAALFGVQMFLGGNGGGAHPEASYRAWLAEAGFGQVDMVDIEAGRRTLLFAA